MPFSTFARSLIKKPVPSNSIIYSNEWKTYDGLMNVDYKKHYRVTHSENVFVNIVRIFY